MIKFGLIRSVRVFGNTVCVLLAAGIACVAAPKSAQPAGKGSELQPMVHIGFSPGMFSGVAREDMVSGLKIWADADLGAKGIRLGSNPRIYNDTGKIKADLLAGKLDVAVMLTMDYLSVEREVPLDHLNFSAFNGAISEKYVLLINRESPVRSLEDLKGQSLIIQSGFRENLAPLWLDTVLMQAGFEEAGGHFGKIEYREDLLKTVLPVFFGKAAACLVTRKGIDSVVEMNPQISRTLRILLKSDELVPSLFCIRSDYNTLLKNEFLSALRAMDEFPPGQRVLQLLQAEEIVPGTAADLAGTRLLIETHTKLKRERLDS